MRLTVKLEEITNKTLKHDSKAVRKLLETEIVSQLFLVLIAGYETTASAIAFSMHEMAINEQSQDKLLKEVQLATAHIDDENSDEFFEVVTTKIPYLEAVIKETL